MYADCLIWINTDVCSPDLDDHDALSPQNAMLQSAAHGHDNGRISGRRRKT